MKKTLLSFLVFFSVGLFAIVIMLGRSFLDIKNIDDDLPRISLGEPRFDPKLVNGFIWDFNHAKYIVRRSPKNYHWETSIKNQVINKRLDFLSRIRGEKIEPLKNIVGSIKLQFKDGTDWMGSYSGRYFRWIQGPLKGEGGRLIEEEIYLFAAGKNVFNLNEISWCPSKIKKISGKNTIMGKELHQWFNQNCHIPIEILIDQKVYDPKKFENKMIVEFENNETKIYEWNNFGLFRLRNNKEVKVFVSKSFLKEINKLNINPLQGN